MGVWSSIRLSDLSSWNDGGGQVEIDGLLQPAGTPSVHLAVVHVNAPVFGPGQPAFWRAQLAAVHQHLAGDPRPLLVAGDFNATWDLQPFQDILHLG